MVESFYDTYLRVVNRILDESISEVTDIKPSDWAEQNIVLGPEEPMPGPFSYDNSPYVREIIDCLDPNNPAKKIAVMKGVQIGLSRGLIMNGAGYIISTHPGNTALMVGHDDLTKDASKKIDNMIDGAGLRGLISDQSGKIRRTKSGDTDKMKEFPGGYLLIGTSNHKTLRQRSLRYGFIDDFDGMKSETNDAGSTRNMIDKRFAAYKDKKKIFYISTPELKLNSNIEPIYLMGDQRQYHLPCPCCNEMIVLEWERESEVDGIDMAGMTWSFDEDGRLLRDSVGYICYKCNGFFTDQNKSELLKNGKWIATAEAKDPEVRSYHISALYAPTYMDGWYEYVKEWIEAHPEGQIRDENAYKTFRNTVLGLTYAPSSHDIKATELQKNCRGYEVGIIPDKFSAEEGNGRIVLLTMTCDINGTVDDTRLDYEVVAWSENGPSYSVDHGSIGSFIPKDPGKIDRDKMTIRHGKDNSAWLKLQELMEKKWPKDSGGSMRIFASGIDTGYQSEYAYPFVNKQNLLCWSLRGDTKEGNFIRIDVDSKTFAQSQEQKNLFIVRGNVIKDRLARWMALNWDEKSGEVQPVGFMNFPSPSNGKYQFVNYFSHFESEHKVIDKDKFIWKKKNNVVQNHLFDCRVYNIAVRDIFLDKIFKEAGIINGTWTDWCNIVLKGK